MNKYFQQFTNFVLLILLVTSPCYANEYKKTVIVDPAISRRCNELLQKRNDKIDHKHKIRDLLERVKRLLKMTPPARLTLKEKMAKTSKSLRKELEMTRDSIQAQEENIVRTGCQGIYLTSQ